MITESGPIIGITFAVCAPIAAVVAVLAARTHDRRQARRTQR